MSALWFRILALSSIAQLCILCPTPSIRSAGATPPPNYVQVWSDEFNGTALDTTNWGYRQPGQFRHDAINIRDAVSVGGGLLTITTYTQGGTHYTGMIQTAEGVPNELQPNGNKYMPRYGYIEASIDFDGTAGMWSSFWLQTPNNLQQGPLDEHDRGMEIDIIEHKKMKGAVDVSAQAPSNLHWMSYSSPVLPNTPDFWHAGGVPHSGNGPLANGFHTYGLEWTPDYLKIYYDDLLVWTVNNTTVHYPLCQSPPCYAAPCIPGQDQSTCVVAPAPHINEYILLCSEVIANNFNGLGDIPPGGYGSLATSTTKMKVDYVRHYQLLVAPSALTATALSFSQINLAWTDNTYGENGFKVERSTDNVNFSEVATVAADVHTYLDTGLDRDTRYYYRVRAYIGTNYSAYSNKANTITDVTPPAAVTNLSLPSLGKMTMAVSWTAPGDDGTGESVVEYDLRRSTSPITAANFGSATRVTTGNPQASGHPECRVVSGLTACTTYYFAVKSRDEAANWSAISNVPSARTLCQQNIVAECVLPDNDIIPPAAVSNLSVPSTGKTTMAVSWTAPGDDGTAGTATEYDFRYSTAPITAANFASATRVIIAAPQAAGTQECRIASGLSPCNVSYYFALKARDEYSNWSAISNVPSAITVCQNWLAECDLGGGAAKHPVTNDEAPRLFSAPRPNPAHGATSFRIMVPSQSQLRVGVFDVQGRRVRSLVNRIASPGPAQIEWNLLDDSGRRVASGLYMVRVNLGDTRKTFRMVVVR
jgi:beta-glucanase (GH16 family)